MPLKPLRKNILPEAPPLKKLVGPSFILLGLGLGSGEVILWPYLASNYGPGIIWGALAGLTFQFIMNMEIERYALARGESVFVGLARVAKFLPFWFILSTFVPWIWPGIATSSATLLGGAVGLKQINLLSIGLLVLMGFILTLGPVLYKTVEGLQKILISVGVPSIFLLSIVLAKSNHWADLVKGLVGIGNGYFLLPAGIPVASFLAALAYAGAGGNLNLAQSFYVKERGYGMGQYAGRITSLFTGRREDVSITGSSFEVTEDSKNRFYSWWKRINIEHFLVFWLTGSITISLLVLLSYATAYGSGGSGGINFVFTETLAISQRISPIAGTFFIIVAGLTLFGTQLTVFDATSRIISENVILGFAGMLKENSLQRIYYFVLWVQIISGITIISFGFDQPMQLLILAAVLNAFAMFVHSGLTLWLNIKSLDRAITPSAVRICAMFLAILFYGGFSFYTLYDNIRSFLAR